ncbi:MAG: hydantoinase B/oxoprolinase family protein, partial [Thaumarchaeota archaeon]
MMNVTFTVPGSEKFHSRQIPLDELRKLISPSLKLHDLSQDAANSIDPITYEVVRHRLWSVTEEMGEALKRMSGSVVVTDANDFNFTITDEVGQEVQIGPYNLHLAASMDLAITWTLQHRSKNPGDVGGVAPGSWTPRSRDVFWESLPTPPVKLVNDYEIVTDVEDLFVRRSRVPKLVALDLRAMIAANKIAHERLKNLVKRYGSNVVKAAMRRIMDDAERRLRAKLTALPDGTWRSVAYQEEAFEGDRGIYKIVLTMTKKADHIIFDFRGTDPQTGMINCTYAGMRAGVLSPVLTIVGGDIPWAPGGIVRCIEIISEEGTLNNATFPAGICKDSVASTWATNNAVVECVSKMLDASQEHRKSGMSISCGTWLLSVLAGTNQYRIPFVTMLMEPMASGLGAKFYRDGIDTGGSADIPMGRAPDAEMTEFMFPVLLIWRREETDSGGPGRFRGGLTGSILLVPHGTDSPLQLVCSGSGRTVSMNLGLAGGYPGNNELAMIIRNGNSRKLLRAGSTPGKLDDLKGERDVLPDEIETTLNPDDAYY